MEIERFIATLNSKNTQSTYRRYAAKFVEWLGEDNLAELEPDELLNYISWLREEGYGASSINLMLSTVRELLRWAVLTKQVQPSIYSVAQAVKGVKEPKVLPRPLNPSEADRLLSQPNLTTVTGARDLAFIKLALVTGCRVSEMTSLNIDTIDWERRRFVVTGKGGRQRVVFFTEDAASALVYYLGLRASPTVGPLFVNTEGKRLSNRWIQKMLSSYGEVAGIAGLHPHQLRHTFATELLDRTGDLALVQDLLGHSDPATTRIYTSLAVGRAERAYNKAMSNIEVRGVLESEVRGGQPAVRVERLQTGAAGLRSGYGRSMGISGGE